MDRDYDDAITEGIRRIIAEVSGFYPLFEAIIEFYGNLITPAVFGVVWRFCQMEDGICKASLRTMGARIGVDDVTVMRHIKILCDDGFLKDLTPDLRNKPHVYADTGRVVMKSKLTASHRSSDGESASVRSTTASHRKATASQSQLSKDLNKDSTKENTTTNEQAPNIFMLYEGNIGPITSYISDALQDAEKIFPAEWIADAIRLAAENNKRNWKYCEAILKRWQTDGKDDGKKPEAKGANYAKRNSNHATAGKPSAEQDAASRALAEQIRAERAARTSV